MKTIAWHVAFITLLFHLVIVQSHRRGTEGGCHLRHDSHNKEVASVKHRTPNRRNGHGGGTLIKPNNQHDNGSAHEIEPKQLGFGFMDGKLFRFQPEKLLVFNDDRYEPWSNWSDCIIKDCIEIRFRKCKDDSWTKRSNSKIHTRQCLSKYFAEKRTCQNKTACNSYVIPEQLGETCGIKPDTNRISLKIVGGNVAPPHSWPWAVRLSVRPPGQKPISFCAGTLVAPQWVVTAAHCLLVENKRMPVGRMVNLRDQMRSSLYVHFGDHDKIKKERAQQDIRVEKAVLHPRYHRKLVADGDDIALVYLEKPVKMTPEVGYACLPTKQLQLEPGTKCYAVGWGGTEAGRTPTFDDISSIIDAIFLPSFSFSSPFFSSRHFSSRNFRRKSYDSTKSSRELMEVELPIISIKECRRHFHELSEDVHICAGEKGKDTCAGDSGGGLYCQLPNSERWFTAGVTSFGLARGCGKTPGVYTSILGHLDWITQVMASSIY